MVARDIAWHEDCLRNQRITLEEQHATEQHRRSQYDRDRARDLAAADRLERQIERAKRLGKNKFDADRFGA